MNRLAIERYGDGGQEWLMIIRRGQVLWERNGRIGTVSREYLARPWYRDPHGNWATLESQVVAFSDGLRCFAFTLLDWWETKIHYQYYRHERKAWSYMGEHLHAEMNICYDLLIKCAIRLRRMYNYPELHTIAGMAAEARGDICEGMLGLAYLWKLRDGTHWKQQILAACFGVRHLWDYFETRRDINWYNGTLADLIVEFEESGELEHLRFDIPPGPHEEAAYRSFNAMVDQRNARSLIVTKLRLPNALKAKIREFLSPN